MFETVRLTLQHFGLSPSSIYNEVYTQQKLAKTYAYWVIGPNIARGFDDLDEAMLVMLGTKPIARMISQKQFLEVLTIFENGGNLP